VFDSDHIARYLVAAYDPADRLGVNRVDAPSLNRLAVVGGIMSNEVVLILARRGGLEDVEGVAYFRKLMSAMESGLAWLERAVDVDEAAFTYGDIATACMWQHLTHYGLVASPERFPRIAARVAFAMARPSVAATTPERSLAEAKAAGWQAG
jgi:glutathione S-transferase